MPVISRSTDPPRSADGRVPGPTGRSGGSGRSRLLRKLPLFGGIERARFRRQVVPGDLFELEVTLGRMSARAGKGTGRASVGGELACQAELLFVLVDAAPSEPG